MNIFFFLEGRRTEPKVYRAWVKHVFPQLTEVRVVSDVQQDNYLMISGFGHPRMLALLDGILDDIRQHGGIDHLFVCLDAEEDPPEVRRQQIETSLSGKLPRTVCHVIIHNCCIETWFLGNFRLMKRNPQSLKLRQFKEFYDVSVDCPELMGCPAPYKVRAHFHLDYLKEMMFERGLSYTKENPGDVRKDAYLKALVERHEKTGHIASFGHLVEEWRAIGGSI